MYSLEQQFDSDSDRDDITMDERLHRWIDQELAAELDRTVVVSNLPASEDDLLNKLEEYLSKSDNCGGYIERIELLDDTSVIIVFFEKKVREDLIPYCRANVMNFFGARLIIETVQQYEHNQDQGNGKVFKGSIFGETTANISSEWLPDVHQYLGRINEMAGKLGLQSASSELGYSFSGNFELLIRLRNQIEWLMFDERGSVLNNDEYMGVVSRFVPDEPVDYTSRNVILKPQKDSVLLSKYQELSYETVNSNPTESDDNINSANGIDDSNKMECNDQSNHLTRGLKFKPELVKYADRVHSAEIDEIKQTCYVNICTTDYGNVEISLSDSVPGTETDVENAVDLLRLLFSEIDQEMVMQCFDLGRFDVGDDFRAMIQTQLMSIVTMVVVRQSKSRVLQIYGKTEVIEDALRKAEDMLVREVERETALKRKLQIEMEMAKEAERRETEAREAERREKEAREAKRREKEAREAERREEEAREAERREAQALQAREAEIEAREAQRREALVQEEERREALARESERMTKIDHKQTMSKEVEVETVTIHQTNSSMEYAAVQDPACQNQPLPPPSTGDDWLEPEILGHQVNGDSPEDVEPDHTDGRAQVSPSANNGTVIMNSEQLRAPPDRNDRNSSKPREKTSPTSTLRPLNSRFHEFLTRNFFQSTSGSGQAHLYDTIFNGVHITVKRGDISKEPAAVVVSSNDVELSCGGALSSIIDKASGSIIHARCLEWMDAYGIPVEGQIVEIDSEGVLPCNKVFFIVMPNWNADPDQTYLESQLRRSCKNILQKARDTRNVSSIAIPGLGTGKFYFPCDVYARVMTDALKEFLQAKGRMLEIRFIDLDFRVLQALQREFQSRLKHPDKASDEQSLSEIYRQTTDNGEPLPTGFVERTPPSGFERIFRRQVSDPNVRARERKWVKQFRSLSETAKETKFESCILCTRRVSVGFFGYIPCKHIICHICSNGMELHEKRACPTCFKSFSKLQISKF